MKTLKICLIVMVSALLTIGLSGNAEAFHSGGVARCSGCHTMHNSLGGARMAGDTTTLGTSFSYLLIRQDASSTCLACHSAGTSTTPSSFRVHSAYAAGTGPSQMTPGGDYGWITKDFTWTPRPGATGTSRGERRGHNIIAADLNLTSDAIHSAAPGGTYSSSRLTCISCHDPHGRYRRDSTGAISNTGLPIKASGSYDTSPDPTTTEAVGVYRLLGGTGYVPESLSGIATAFVNTVPAAVAPSTYNRSEVSTQTRVAYGKNMSEWCANCHTQMHNDSYPGNLRHPAGNLARLTPTVINNYNAYVKSGDLTGIPTSSFTSLVPFEEGTDDYTALKGLAKNDNTQLGGPGTSASVSCLTCHRAHASGWDSMLRWNARSDFVVYNSKYSQEGEANQPYGQGRTEAEAKRAYYERPVTTFATYQRSLCNKCHVKD